MTGSWEGGGESGGRRVGDGEELERTITDCYGGAALEVIKGLIFFSRPCSINQYRRWFVDCCRI